MIRKFMIGRDEKIFLSYSPPASRRCSLIRAGRKERGLNLNIMGFYFRLRSGNFGTDYLNAQALRQEWLCDEWDKPPKWLKRIIE
jgi:hypothetical protein